MPNPILFNEKELRTLSWICKDAYANLMADGYEKSPVCPRVLGIIARVEQELDNRIYEE